MAAGHSIETIDGPGELLFPFGKPIFDDLEIFYHGTRSSFTNKIEKAGWIPNDLPYRMSDVSRLCEIFDSLYFYGSLGHYYIPTLQKFSLGDRSKYAVLKPISFSGSYWLARNYADTRGGETINAIIGAADDFETLLLNPDSLKEHQEHLAKRLSSLKELPGHPQTSTLVESIKNLENGAYLEKCLEEIASIRKYYLESTNEDYPVVYAVRLEANVLSEPQIKSLLSGLIRDLTRHERRYEARIDSLITPDAIVARADYVNGIDYWTPSFGNPLPLPWLATDMKD